MCAKVIDITREKCTIDIVEEYIERGFCVRGMVEALEDSVEFYIFMEREATLGMTIKKRNNNWSRIETFIQKRFMKEDYLNRKVIEWLWSHATMLSVLKHDL